MASKLRYVEMCTRVKTQGYWFSALSLQPSALSLQPSALSPQPSAFILLYSAFAIQPSIKNHLYN